MTIYSVHDILKEATTRAQTHTMTEQIVGCWDKDEGRCWLQESMTKCFKMMEILCIMIVVVILQLYNYMCLKLLSCMHKK